MIGLLMQLLSQIDLQSPEQYTTTYPRSSDLQKQCDTMLRAPTLCRTLNLSTRLECSPEEFALIHERMTESGPKVCTEVIATNAKA
jgi:hypothetical protein